jgi:hypothetical protein
MMFSSSIHLPENGKMSFFLIDNKISLYIWGWYQCGGEDKRKGCMRVTMVETYVLVYENEKIRSLKPLQKWVEGGKGE